MTAAYETLSSSMQRYLGGMTAEHGLSRIAEMKQRAGHAGPDEVAAAIAEDRRATHPVVHVHPETGARALYVNPTYTRWLDGVPADESDAVLDSDGCVALTGSDAGKLSISPASSLACIS